MLTGAPAPTGKRLCPACRLAVAELRMISLKLSAIVFSASTSRARWFARRSSRRSGPILRANSLLSVRRAVASPFCTKFVAARPMI